MYLYIDHHPSHCTLMKRHHAHQERKRKRKRKRDRDRDRDRERQSDKETERGLVSWFGDSDPCVFCFVPGLIRASVEFK